MTVTIIEDSWLARIAAYKLGGDKVAMVIGKKIYLHGCTKQQFLKDKKWVRHEIAHVQQWQKFGKFCFTILYLLESFNKGYYHNRYEVEARNKENDLLILNKVKFT